MNHAEHHTSPLYLVVVVLVVVVVVVVVVGQTVGSISSIERWPTTVRWHLPESEGMQLYVNKGTIKLILDSRVASSSSQIN